MNLLKRHPVASIFIAIGIVLAVTTAVYLSKTEAATEKTPVASKAALTVTTATPTRVNLPIRLSANGSIAAWQEAIIGSEAAGLRLTEVRVNVGDRVSQGQVLAVFALESVQAEVAQTRASVLEAEANALDAAGNAAKARTLQASGALSEQQINQYLTLEKTAQARLEVARATLTVQQVRLKQTQLLAPDSGVISARSATVGSVVGSGTELFRMIRGGRLEWRAEVTSAELGRIKPGDKAAVLAASGTQVEGRVRMVAPTVDPTTRTALVYVDLPANAELKAGMYAKGDFALGTSDTLTLQQQALVLRDGFTYALRVDASNKVSQIKLKTGRRVGDAVEILQGAKAGENYVSSGAAFLADGDTVKVVAATAAAPVRPASQAQ